MEWTQTAMPPALPGQLDPLADDIGQRDALAQIFQKFGWYGHVSPKVRSAPM